LISFLEILFKYNKSIKLSRPLSGGPFDKYSVAASFLISVFLNGLLQ